MGELAMALKDYQARGFERFTMLLNETAQIYPQAIDIINFEKALPDIATTYGMKIEHLATEEQIQQKRLQRQQQQQQLQQAMLAQAAAKVYSDTNQPVQENSPAQTLVSGI